jgi:hypothetical protein
MIAANKGTQSGWLVPLSAGLCYLGKQGSFMPKGSISRVAFHRAGGGSSTFDITIKLSAAAAAAGKDLDLGQIDAAELAKLQAYCLNQRIKVCHCCCCLCDCVTVLLLVHAEGLCPPRLRQRISDSSIICHVMQPVSLTLPSPLAGAASTWAYSVVI